MERARLSAARLRKYWTLEEAASQIGVDKATLLRWEKGRSTPQPLHLRKLCEVYGVASVSELDIEEAEGTQLSSSLKNPNDDVEDTTHAVYASFRREYLPMRLLHIVWHWPSHDARYHELQRLILLELGDNSMNPEEHIRRRDALRMLAALPIEIYGLSAFKPVIKREPQEILVQCAAGITACWQLRRGKELAFAASVVSKYLPTLQEIAGSARSAQSIGASDLLSQCYLLKSLLAVHLGESTAVSLHYARLSEQYGERAGSLILQIVALRAQANAHDYAEHWKQALQAAQKAQYLLEANKEADVSPLIASYVYAGMANYEGHVGHKQEALRTLGRAHTAFWASAANSAPPIWIDHDQGNLLLHDGLAHYYLGLQKEAIDSFAQISALPARDRKETTHGESLIDQVLAEIQREDQPRDRDFCITLWTQGIEMAMQMRSEERYNEALAVFTAMRAAWPGDSRIKELRDLAIHW